MGKKLGLPNVASWSAGLRVAAHHCISGGFAVVDMESVHNDVGNVLQRQACSTRDVHVSSASIQCFPAVDNELLLERDHHVVCEDYPQRLGLNHAPSQRPVCGVRGVITGICHHVDCTIAASDGVLAESDCAVCQRLTVLFPVGIACPAVVDWVSRSAHR